MSEKDIVRLKVGKHAVSIMGMQMLMREMAQDHAGKSDEEVRTTMLKRLGKVNYIPGVAKDDYGRAFVREFRKFMGQPYNEEPPSGLEVKVLGMGCASCHALVQTVMEILTEIGVPASLDHVTDIREIGKYGAKGVPALVINEKVVAVGNIPSKDRIKSWLLDASSRVCAKT